MLEIKHETSLRPYNTMGVDGTATVVTWDTTDDLCCFFNNSRYADINREVLPVGGGSNMLFLDPECSKTLLVKRLAGESERRDNHDGTETWRVSASTLLDDVCQATVNEGLWGLQALSLIPGTTGGAAVQNAGAYGAEMSDVVESIEAFDRMTGKPVTLDREFMSYGYRDSALKHSPVKERYIIDAVNVRLSKTKPEISGRSGKIYATPLEERLEVIATRRAKLPEVSTTGSAGSYFKNPVIDAVALNQLKQALTTHNITTDGMPLYTVGPDRYKLSAAWLLDRAGLKGVKEGNVGTWPLQPLVIVNLTGQAKGREIADFARRLSERVEDLFTIRLTPEVEYI